MPDATVEKPTNSRKMMNAGKLTYALVLSLLALDGQAWALDPVDHQPIADLRTALKSSGQVRIAQGGQNILARDDNTGELVPATSLLMLTTNKGTGDWTISILHTKIIGSTALIGTGLQQISSDAPQSLPTFDRNKAAGIVAAMNARGTGYYPDEVQRLAKESGCKRLYSGSITFTLNSALSVAAAYNQYVIDSNQLTLNIDGQNIKISQGDLRKSMVNRVKELEAQRAQLAANNGDPSEIAKTDHLLAKYGAEKTQLGDVATPDFTVMEPVFMDLLAAPNGDFHILVVDQYGAAAEIASGNAFGPNS